MHAFFVLAGTIAQRVADGNAYVLAPIPASLVIVAAFLGFKRTGKEVQGLVSRAASGMAGFGADYSLGLALAIVIASLGDWARWVLFAVYFSIAVVMISLGDFATAARGAGAVSPSPISGEGNVRLSKSNDLSNS